MSPDLAGAADTLTEALSRAYGTNPELNAERARQRATDETVAQALSGYRPSVTGTADVGVQATETELANPTTARVPGGGFAVNATQANTLYPRGVGVAVQQSLFNGFRTTNTVKQAESGVRAGREALRNVEQNVLLDAVTAYMDVLRDLAIVELRRSNVAFLTETLRATRDRFNVGEVTRTDVAQAEARLSRGQS
ncbi:MAG: TolC family protein, partial [Pseudomonadota bacterium]|nr:TolC family protein [Pseudomonadota bacterium]